MSRIVITGNSGGGKTTLAKKLALHNVLPWVELDAMLWNEDWTLVPSDIFESRHQVLLKQDRWVIDGLGRRESIADRIGRATQVILIDLPLWVHFLLAANRHVALVTGHSESGPDGFRSVPPLEGLFRTIWEVDQSWMPDIRALSDVAEQNRTDVIRIRSLAELDALTPVRLKHRLDNSEPPA